VLYAISSGLAKRWYFESSTSPLPEPFEVRKEAVEIASLLILLG
jgi:hypothetical protein